MTHQNGHSAVTFRNQLAWTIAGLALSGVVGCAATDHARMHLPARTDASHAHLQSSTDAPRRQSADAVEGRAQASRERTSRVQPLPLDDEFAEAIKEGATMKDVARRRDPIAATPEEAVAELRAGNARFFSGVAQRPEQSAIQRRAQILSQTPFAIILGCSDSRVPTEIVYDQGLGSLFVVRVAGNIADPGTMGSVEYAVRHLKSKVLVVMGHEGCGAVAAALLPQAEVAKEPGNVRYLLDRIRPALGSMSPIRDNKARMREAVNHNVRLQVAEAMKNPLIAEAVAAGKLKVIGAYYEIGSGAVDFLERPEELLFDLPNKPAGASGNAPAKQPAASAR